MRAPTKYEVKAVKNGFCPFCKCETFWEKRQTRTRGYLICDRCEAQFDGYFTTAGCFHLKLVLSGHPEMRGPVRNFLRKFFASLNPKYGV